MKNKTIKGFYLITVFSILMISFSCYNSRETDNDHLVFRYNEHSNITTLDPAFASNPQLIWPTNQIFNSLVQLSSQLDIKPDIAKSWDYNDSTLTYTFKLREDVYFHKSIVFAKNLKDSTRNVTAYDFEYSFNRLLDDKVAARGRWVLNNVKQFYAKNDSTFIIQLKKPFPAFLGLLSMRFCSVVPKEAIDYYGNNFRSNPVGTGPFVMKLWEENVKLVLRKNPIYFEKDEEGKQLPYLEAIAITFLPDKQSEFLQFVQGKLDFISGLDNSYKDDLITTKGKLQKKYENKFNMISSPYLNTEYLGFFMRSNSSEIQSKKIRQAVNYGFNRDEMITYLRNGIGIPAKHGFIPKGLPGFNELDGFTYQPIKAKNLVNQYIKESGNKNPSIIIGTNSQYLDLCEYIQRELEKIGIKVIIDVVPPSTLRQLKSSGELDVFRASWIADYPDAENYLSLFYGKNFTPKGPNYTHFKNKFYDSLYEKSLSILDIDRRKLVYEQMDSIIINEAPVVPLYYDMAVRFVNKKVTGLGINPQNFLVLKRVKKSN
jgi:peptide/nickel transport system substrate-binding protein